MTCWTEALELWSMISAIERHATLAERRSRQLAAVLRLLTVRRQGLRVWGAEETEILTPDLWVGFLDPATALGMWAKAYPFPLLSVPGLKLAATVTSSNLHTRPMAATPGPAADPAGVAAGAISFSRGDNGEAEAYAIEHSSAWREVRPVRSK